MKTAENSCCNDGIPSVLALEVTAFGAPSASARSPQRVRRRHLTDENAGLLIQRWTAARSAVRTSGLSAAEPVAMPSDNVSGCTTANAVRQFCQPRATSIQAVDRHVRGAGGRRTFHRPQLLPSARLSKTSSRRPRSVNGSARATMRSSSSMHRSWLASMRKINGNEFWRGSGCATSCTAAASGAVLRAAPTNRRRRGHADGELGPLHQRIPQLTVGTEADRRRHAGVRAPDQSSGVQL
jgi:hypothetical protein